MSNSNFLDISQIFLITKKKKIPKNLMTSEYVAGPVEGNFVKSFGKEDQ